MKKHVIIAGVPRAGKSTLSQIISKYYGYQHISMDSIIAGIEKVFPETGIDSDADTDIQGNIQYISSKMALFIQAIIVCAEEIFDNYEILLGYAPPRYYYEDDAGNRLTYRSQDIMTATHEIEYHGIDYSRQSLKVHD